MKSEALNQTQNIKNPNAKITSADGTNLKTIYTSGSNDAVVKSVNVVSDDTAARVINLYIGDGTTDTLIGAVNIPVSSGSNGTVASVDLLSGVLISGLAYDGAGKRILPLQAGYTLKISSQTAVTAAKTISVVGIVEEY